MVVVPTSHDVTLTYGTSSADELGLLATLIGLAALIWLFVVPRSAAGGAAPEPEFRRPARRRPQLG